MLERKIILTLLLCILLPTFLLGGVAYFSAFESLRAEKMKTVGLIAQAKHDTLIDKLSSEQQRLQLFGESILLECQLTPIADKQCLSTKTSQYFNTEKAIGLVIFDDQEQQIFSYGQSLITHLNEFNNHQQLAYFSKKGQFAISRYAIHAHTQSLSLFITFQADNLYSIFTPPNELGSSGEVFLADGDGFFLTPPKYHSHQGISESIMAKPMRNCLLGHNKEVIDVDYRDVDVIHGYQFIPEIGSGCIMAHIEQVEAFSPLQIIELKIALFGLLVMFLVIVVSIALTKRIVNPIIALTDVTRRIHQGDLTIRAHENVHDEIGELGASFNRLTRSLLENQAQLESSITQRTEALAWSEYTLSTIINNINDAVISINDKGIISTFNRSAEKLLGYSAAEIIGQDVACLMPHEHAKNHGTYLNNYLTTGIKHIIDTQRELQAKTKTGQLIDISLSVSETTLAGKRMFVGSMRDIADQKKIEKQQQLFEAVFSFTQEAMCIIDDNYQLIQTNATFDSTFKHTLSSDAQLKRLIFDQTVEVTHQTTLLDDYLTSHLSWSGELELNNRNGQACTYWINISLIKLASERNFVISFSDISHKKKEQERIRFLANHDPLTGLLNRPALFEHMEHCQNVAARSQLLIALLFIDLDNFKRINDNFGHDVGDELLVHIANQLKLHTRKSDFVARIGGDEFVVSFVSVESKQQVAELSAQLLTSINQLVVINDIEIVPLVSMGIAMYPDDASTLAQLLKCADEAMYTVKHTGKNGFAFFNAEP